MALLPLPNLTLPSDQFQQISFVNNLYTEKGGTHVDKVTSQLCKALSAELAKKNKGGIKLKSNFLKNTMAVYVNCFVNNPSFNSQSKEYLSSPPSSWGSTCKLPDDFLKKGSSSSCFTTSSHSSPSSPS